MSLIERYLWTFVGVWIGLEVLIRVERLSDWVWVKWFAWRWRVTRRPYQRPDRVWPSMPDQSETRK